MTVSYKRLLLLILIGILTWNAYPSFAAQPEFPKPTGYVTDEAKIIPAQAKKALNYYSQELEKQTGAQVVSVIVSDLRGSTVENYAIRLFETWKIGQSGKDNGILLLTSVGDRKVRIEVGYGLEGTLPDGKAGELLDTYVIPYFKQGKIANGVINGHLALIETIQPGLTGQTPKAAQQSHAQGISPFWLLLLLLLLFGGGRGRRGGLLQGLLLGSILGSAGRGGGFGGFGGGGGFGGFGGGLSGGGGASRGW